MSTLGLHKGSTSTSASTYVEVQATVLHSTGRRTKYRTAIQVIGLRTSTCRRRTSYVLEHTKVRVVTTILFQNPFSLLVRRTRTSAVLLVLVLLVQVGFVNLLRTSTFTWCNTTHFHSGMGSPESQPESILKQLEQYISTSNSYKATTKHWKWGTSAILIEHGQDNSCKKCSTDLFFNVYS
jgi:hypothetical protein